MKRNFELIPAIDLIDGKCVRLKQGDYALKTVYSDNPLDMALKFQDVGVKRLHLVDLDGAKKGEVVNLSVLEKISSNTNLIIDFGGGIKSDASIENVFNAGAHLATIGSLAVKNRPLFENWIEKYGADRIFLGADVKNEKIAVGGWLETTDVEVYDFVESYMQKGLNYIFCTDISKDGLLEGPSLKLYSKMIERLEGLELIASGGVSSMEDIVALESAGCAGVIVGKAIYEGRISWKELEDYNRKLN
jgi:phosphoribosylformimino-5-aminoimidazole carboxamide ribotide isomerase